MVEKMVVLLANETDDEMVAEMVAELVGRLAD